MVPLKLEALRNFLNSLGINIQLQEETGQLYFLLKIAETEYPVFFRIVPDSELLQVITFIPCNFTTKTAPDVARLLHLLNKEIDLPGFGMDENTSVVFYRLMIPAKDAQVDTDLLQAYISALEVVSNTFAPTITGIALGIAPYEEVLKKARDAGVIS